MKKWLVIVFLIAAFWGVARCYSFENQATTQMRKSLSKLPQNARSLSVKEIEFLVSTDSLIVLHCYTKGKTNCGETTYMSLEYVYVCSGDSIYEYVNNNESVVASAEYNNGYKDNLNLQSNQFYSYVLSQCKINGKKVN